MNIGIFLESRGKTIDLCALRWVCPQDAQLNNILWKISGDSPPLGTLLGHTQLKDTRDRDIERERR